VLLYVTSRRWREPTSAGTFVSPEGEEGTTSWQGLAARGAKYLESPKSGAIYPAKWALKVPKLDLTLQHSHARSGTQYRDCNLLGGQLLSKVPGNVIPQGKGYVD